MTTKAKPKPETDELVEEIITIAETDHRETKDGGHERTLDDGVSVSLAPLAYKGAHVEIEGPCNDDPRRDAIVSGIADHENLELFRSDHENGRWFAAIKDTARTGLTA